ncbi:hypothetical protein SAMN05421787_12132 [Virgibacillus pantothenticus]|nr:hypothetical protein SAMN05421787_12132 [Virgibacillus pantothenticus]
MIYVSIGKMLEKKIQTTNVFKEKQQNHAIYLKKFEQNNRIDAYKKDQENWNK